MKIYSNEFDLNQVKENLLVEPDIKQFPIYYANKKFLTEHVKPNMVYDDESKLSVVDLHTVFFNFYRQKFVNNLIRADVFDELQHYFLLMLNFMLINSDLFYDSEIKIFCLLLNENQKKLRNTFN